MAITWNVKINELGSGSGNYSVAAEVTDDTKPVDHQTETVSVSSCKFSTVAQKNAVYAELKSQYQTKIDKTAVISALESDAKTALEK